MSMSSRASSHAVKAGLGLPLGGECSGYGQPPGIAFRIDPVDVWACCPAEEEEAYGQHYDAEESRDEAMFGFAEAIFLDVRD